MTTNETVIENIRLAAVPETYKIMRGWRDGEPMRDHEVTDEIFTDFARASTYCQAYGGTIVRQSDGANFVGCDDQWIDPQTGYRAPARAFEAVVEAVANA